MIPLEKDLFWYNLRKGRSQNPKIHLNIKGTVHHLQATYMPIMDDLKQVRKIILVGQDITQMMQQQTEIESQNYLLKQQQDEISVQNEELHSTKKS